MKINRKYLIIGTLALVVVAAIVVGLLLGKNNKEDGPQVIGVFMSDGRTEQEKTLVAQIADQLERNNFAVKVYDANGDQATQNQQFAEFLEGKCHGALLCPVMPDSTANLVQQAKENHVPLVFIEKEPAQEILDMWDRVAYVGCNAAEVGKLQGQLILGQAQKSDINGDGIISYVVLRDSQDSTATSRRVQGAVDTMKESIAVSLLNDASSGDDRAAAKETLGKLLANYGKDIEVVICANDTIALGAMDAVLDGGRTVGKDIYLIGADGSAKALEQIKAGQISGTVLCDFRNQAQKMAALLQELLIQPAAQKQSYVNHATVTKENAEEFLK